MAQVAIRTEKLVHTYPRGNVMALKGVDLEIYVGDILSIVGQNGSGSILIISHQERILNIADEIVVIADGKVVNQVLAGILSK